MPDLPIYVVIDGTAGLTMSEANGFLIMAVGPGARTWIVNTETSPFVNDEEEISRTLGPGTIRLQTLVLASSDAQMDARLAAVLAAVEQATYNLSVYINGVLRNKWACRGARVTVIGEDGDIDARRYAVHQQIFTANLPRNPVPVVGPM